MQGAHKSHQTNLSRLHDVFVGPLIVRRIPLRLRIAALVLLAVAGCGFEHDEAIDGPYRLVATDVDEQMAVCYTLPDGCIGRVSATVYAVGYDSQYIVAARHPTSNRTATEYFYLARSLDGPLVDPSVSVRGPFDAATFEARRDKLHLPSFSRENSKLK